MGKHLNDNVFYYMPSGMKVHPCRLILRDGTLMWKHACLYNNEVQLPTEEAHEQHIVKTAQRLEELNSWVSQGLDPWQCLLPVTWYIPTEPELYEGISVYFKHTDYSSRDVYDKLINHIQSHESLELRQDYLFFKRC